MKQNLLFSEKLEQVHDHLLSLARLLERAEVKPRPHIAPGWADGTEVMEALHISQRTLQTLRDNGTLGYTTLGKKFYYRIREIDDLLHNNYVMYKLSALGKEDEKPAASPETKNESSALSPGSEEKIWRQTPPAMTGKEKAYE